MKPVTDKYSTVAGDKGLYLVTEFQRELVALSDANLCQLILQNLLDNAVKFTLRGGITVETDLTDSHEKRYVVIRVKDTGIGIERKNIDTIFEEFRQVSEGYNRSFEGSGLGLTLARKMAHLLDGKITVESETGLGSVFSLWLPAVCMRAISPANPGPSESFSDLREVNVITPATLPRILIVEDNDDNAEIMKLYLEGQYQTDRARDASSAIELARDGSYHCVLMDIHLGPGPDGLFATRMIKGIGGYEQIPVVAITGYTLAGDRDRLLTEGCTHYLSKPFSQQELLSIVNNCLTS